jgi:hypothetical protein
MIEGRRFPHLRYNQEIRRRLSRSRRTLRVFKETLPFWTRILVPVEFYLVNPIVAGWRTLHRRT